MPPKSRKRNKGKERKAKKADKAELERSNANRFWQEWKSMEEATCMHGNDTTITNDHPISKFIDEFFIQWRRHKSLADILQDTLQTHSQVWKDNNYRELVTNALTTIGTNMLLVDDDQINKVALGMAKTIVALEHYDSSEGLSLNSSFYTHGRYANIKSRDFASDISTKRDVLKFYRKRLPCKCLKRIHLEARKTIPKMGKCFNCKVEKKRMDLSVCSRCMVDQYCSRECQIARWPRHKSVCNKRHQYNLKKQIEETDMARMELDSGLLTRK